jgi:hypothetical protein
MVADWRARMGDAKPPADTFFFGTVILAPFIGPSGTGWADVRRAQLEKLMLLDNVGYASAVDIGDPQAPFGSYHPRHKQVPGARLAAAALDVAYGVATPWRGPEFAGASVKSNADGSVAVSLSFAPASLGPSGALRLDYSGNNSACPVAQGVPAAICEDFVVLATPGSSPPPVSYAYLGAGFLAAGDDLATCAACTLPQAEARCSADALCVGLTFASNKTDCSDRVGAACDVYLKSVVSFNAAAGWQAYSNGRRPGGLAAVNVTVALAADAKSVTLASTAPLAEGQAVVAVSYAYSTWPVTPLYNADGIPALPFFANVTS